MQYLEGIFRDMAKPHYDFERDGQIAFFSNYGIPYEADSTILIDYTDGIYNGNILEFKLNIVDTNKVLYQVIKYLSHMRIKGESIPATILLVDLNDTKVYKYNSKDYKQLIQKVYTGAASKNTDGFIGGDPVSVLDYSNSLDSSIVKKILKRKKLITEMYMPIDIDEDCIVGWAERYYRELPIASKGDFLGDDTGTAVQVKGEIREPRHFKYLINPYCGRTNERFKYLMDCLNDKLNKKDLGAFYTPILYAKKAAELVVKAIDKVPEGNDYIILDRCAGTGNLESALIDLIDKKGDHIITHCVVSTYEYYEYKVLNERIGDLVREIIPPTEADVIYENGKVSNADAMSEDFLNNPIISQYVNNSQCTIILYENPPFRDITANDKVDIKEKTYIYEKFVENGTNQSNHRDLSNLFIWSGFRYYLRQQTDSYIVLSPVKYFKEDTLIDRKLTKGYLFNKKFFHASSSSISCVYWENIYDNRQKWELEIVDIEDNRLVSKGILIINRVHNSISQYSDHRIFQDDIDTNVVCLSDGTPRMYSSIKGKTPIFNSNIIAYIQSQAFPLNAMNKCLVRCNWKNGIEQCKGFPLRRDVYLYKLPLWVAKLFPQDEWYDKDVYFTTSDKGDEYTHDKDFLKVCLIYTCLSNQNKCLSFNGCDGRYYKNELCFDNGTLALHDIVKMNLNKDEQLLMSLWNTILQEARMTGKCNIGWSYGVYQITKQINTFSKTGIGKKQKVIYDFPQLNGHLDTLRVMLKDYYKNNITEKMFKYELLK